MATTVDDADKAIARAQAQLDKANADKAAAEKAIASPRAPEVVLGDALTALSMRLGNRPQVKALIDEYKAATKQTPPPAEKPTS